ncbi:FAD-dependent oxidoreductase [Nocardioides sp. WS12]|uniref:FAD-dependent oxidoreductase n=1 Tax=Nocardioides sp. WS12 TaxID=2486272 RepID=UPI0015F88C20|nr:FAD-dependent oxidoreductase [Nocardioides sp. WS12]
MAYVITQPCCNDASCIDVCPVDCIRPAPGDPAFATAEMLYIDGATCIDCGACTDACPVGAIFPDNELTDFDLRYAAINADYFAAHPLEPVSPPPTAPRFPERESPLRVAIVGAGPAACYAAEELLRLGRRSVEVEMFDRLPTPWGLVRAGVAPDHAGTKAVTESFRSMLSKPTFNFHLNVEIGHHLTHDELLEHHHAVLYAVGASADRRLNVPGEDLAGSHPATEFVGWYNGHPDHAGHTFDLSGERAVIVGNGNVALDVARILLTDPDELARTDIAEHALAALRESRVREVVVLGRRGPAQAAYTSPEFLALGRLADLDVVIDPAELSEESGSGEGGLKVELAAEYAGRTLDPAKKRIVFRFLTTPTEIHGADRVHSITVGNNVLMAGPDGTIQAHPTGRTEVITTSLVLRSIGYRGVPVPSLPFDDAGGVLPQADGRVLDPVTGEPLTGVYTAGWIKRGASGVIGTNKWCAKETVAALVEDARAGLLSDSVRSAVDLAALVADRQPDAIDGAGWASIDRAERQRGKDRGRPRIKLTEVGPMVALARGRTA